MKVTEKLKKEKSPLLKPQTALNNKKADSKKPSAKKHDLVMPKSRSTPTQHSASATPTTKLALDSPQAHNRRNSSILRLPAAKTRPKPVWERPRVLLPEIIS